MFMKVFKRELLGEVLLFFSFLPLFNFLQPVLEELSCSFHLDDLCGWEFIGTHPSNYSFESRFNNSNVDEDIEENVKERILVIGLTKQDDKNRFAEYSIKSRQFHTGDFELSFNLKMNFKGHVYVIVVNERNIESQILKIMGSRSNIWETYSIKLPKNDTINVILEFKFDKVNSLTDFIAINKINIVDKRRASGSGQCFHHCSQSEICITRSQVCDTVFDCPEEDDEMAKCDQLPKGSYCSFKNNFCNWFNYNNENANWIYLANEGLGAFFRGEHHFANEANLKSVLFNEIPLYHSVVSSKYYQTCQISFAYMFSATSAALSLSLEPEVGQQKLHSIRLWRYYNKKHTFEWKNVTAVLPVNFHYKYRLIFNVALGLRSSSSFSQTKYVSISRVSLNKECFGIDVPENEPRIPSFLTSFATTESFHIPNEQSVKKRYRFTSCGAEGRLGPNYSQCEAYYLNTTTRAAIFENSNLNLNGSQMWTVPKSGYYSVYARGADGGKGLFNHSGGIGALVRAVFYLQEGDTLFFVIGHAGTDACNSQNKKDDQCKPGSEKKSNIEAGGGGGGGTYVFQLKPSLLENWTPLLIAGGGGGGSGDPDFKYSINQNGQGFDFYNIGIEGTGEGPGGGWNFTNVVKMQTNQQSGKSLLFGAEGGVPCRSRFKWKTDGGFGGGGGGCSIGGGGGGFHGGNSNRYSEAGDGGTSFVEFNESFLQSYSDVNKEPNYFDIPPQGGEVIIVPQIESCCNLNHLPCLVTGELTNGTLLKHCICGVDKFMLNECVYEKMNYLTLIWAILFILLLMLLTFMLSFIVTQKRSAKKKSEIQSNESTSMQLIQNSSTDPQLTINPNYDFGGSTCSLQDLTEIPREKLSLVKALGQGAFGEVYQGYLHNLPGEITDELPVAVKTLPEYSANKQSEMDFLLEALIMSKFKHRNVVRFIGVCFDKMPRFIVLELLPGGDMKTFLRENRSTIDHRSQLVMGDLLVMALDVAAGCQYLEERHFIHRDIAARNCLLTSKIKMPSSKEQIPAISDIFDPGNYTNGFNNSGVVAKIADFGMARDIYRADYYRKGGKTMLPVKWMPPEAFLDGVFTSKTDVWSFGVLLWEILSMGYMPYPGRGNQEVMQLVTAGGRLEAPNSSTPPQVYSIMSHCWNATPEFRPNFSAIIEKIGQCLLDPNVLNVNLPVFHRAASVEKDITLMRPPAEVTDYLIPNNLGSQSASNYSMTTEKTELLSPDTCSTLSCMNEDKLMELDERMQMFPTGNAAIWNNSALNGAMPLGLNVNNMTYNIVPGGQLNPEIILNANSLAYPNACVRYMNVNVTSELYDDHPSDGLNPVENIISSNCNPNSNC